MRAAALAAAALLALPACQSPVADVVAREAARSVVDAEVRRRFPGAPVKPVTDCVIDNATAAEILTVATAAATGPDARTAQVVGGVLQRPETLRCLAEGALPAVLAGL